MANFHFFTDVDRINKISEGAGPEKHHLPFGPLQWATGPSNNKYNVSSMHFARTPVGSVTQRPSAYAVCDGTIIFRSINQLGSTDPVDSGLIDIILKPSVQSEVNPRIKYFVYKSVLLKSVATKDTSGNWNFKTNSTVSGLESKWVNRFITNSPVTPVPIPLIGGVTGLNDIFGNPASDLSYLDDLFGDNLSFSVNAGDEIGRFPNEDDHTNTNLVTDADNSFCVFGFEILLDNHGFHPKLGDIGTPIGHRHYSFSDGFNGYEDAMLKAHILDFTGSGLSHTASDFTSNAGQRFKYETSKEEILNYMDPAAYFGNFARRSVNENDTLTLHRKGIFSDEGGTGILTIPRAASTKSQKRLISEYLLFSLESASNRIFSNYNKVYVDLRDQYGNSHNYFHRYGLVDGSPVPDEIKDLKISFSSSSGTNMAISSKQRYQDGSNVRTYPLVELESHFDGITPTTFTPEANMLTCAIQFKVHMDDLNSNNEPAKYDLYADCAVNVSIQPTTSSSRTNLDLNANSKFYSLKFNAGYTTPLLFGLIHILDEDDKEILLSQYIRLYIIRHETGIYGNPPLTPSSNTSDAYYSDVTATKVPELKNYEYLDNLWMPFQRAERLPAGSTSSGIFTTLSSRYLNNVQADGCDYIADIGEAIDNTNGFRTVFANAHHSRRMNFRGNGTNNNPTSISLIPNDLPLFSGKGDGNLYTRLLGLVNTPGLRKKIDLSAIPETLPSTDPGKAQIVDGLRQFSSVFSVQNQLPSAGLSRFTDGFTGITFSSAQWTQLWNIYNYHFTSSGAPLLPGFKTYLGFVHDGVGSDASNNEYVRFKVVIRGFKDLSGQNRVVIQEFDQSPGNGPVYHYIFYPSYDVRGNSDLIGSSSPTQFGSSHIMKNHIAEDTNYVTVHSVESNMLFARGINMSWKDLTEMKKYVRENIEEVFDTDTNVGTWEIYNTNGINDMTLGTAPDTSDVHFDTEYPDQVGAKITIDLATPSDYYRINPGQSVISVLKVVQPRRSFVTSRRTGVFYCCYPTAKLNDPARNWHDIATACGNTAAHEFGHLVGLQDRYCFRGRVSLNTGFKIAHPSGNPQPALVLYIPETTDSFYHNKYRWQFNLMNNGGMGVPDTLSSVPYFKDAAGNHEALFTGEYSAYATFTASETYRHAVFITPKQWNHILNYQNEDGIFGAQHLFFKSVGNNTVSPANTFNGSFVGWRNSSATGITNDNDLVSEDHFASPASISNHKMSQRIDAATSYWGWIFSDSILSLSNAPALDISSGGLMTLDWLISTNEIPAPLPFYDLRPETEAEAIAAGLSKDNKDYFNLSELAPPIEYGPKVPNTDTASIDITLPISNRGADVWEEETPTNVTTTPANRIYHNHPNRKIIADILADPNQI